MSLSEQIKRVDGSQNSTLKTILEKLGVSPGTSKIDQYPSIANGISNKIYPENIVSSSTSTSYGLSSSATANDVFVKIHSLINEAKTIANEKITVVTGVYAISIMSGEYRINLGFKPKAVLVANCNYNGGYSDVSGYFGDGNTQFTIDNALIIGTRSGSLDRAHIGSLETYGFRVYQDSNMVVNLAGNQHIYIAFR